MKRPDDVRIRPMTAQDIPRLSQIDANFESPAYLDVIKEADGLNVTWHLIERPFATPFACTDYKLEGQELRDIGRRLKAGGGLWLVAEAPSPPLSPPPGGKPVGRGGLVGMVDVERESWREAASVWNIVVDRAYRGRGLGRELMERAIAWGRREGLRAIILETQTNNWPACRFYQRFGFQLTGVDDHYYTNQDVANKEVAIFWTYEL